MPDNIFPDPAIGLTSNQVASLQESYGKNLLLTKRSKKVYELVKGIVTEPMVLLLSLATVLYFFLSEINEAFMMLAGMAVMIMISLYQQAKSSRAIAALNDITARRVKVVREGKQVYIDSAELVPGDIILLEEGMNIPADAIVTSQHDLTVNEAAITGESLPAEKNSTALQLYMGTHINSGSCVARVTGTGYNTTLGRIGKSIDQYSTNKSLLQIQIGHFVKRLALFGFAGFVLIFLLNYLHYKSFIPSLLFALTLAMSVIPEEIPVAFSSFMALGAYKMSRIGIICRQPQVIENLGAVDVLCLDKTGTITENTMEVKMLSDAAGNTIYDVADPGHRAEAARLLWYAMLASEEQPYDAMEVAICKAYAASSRYSNESVSGKIHEYPLTGTPPMMTHVYAHSATHLVTAKGAAEKILEVCRLDVNERKKISLQVETMAAQGFRVLGVAAATHSGNEFPKNQEDFDWRYEGLLGIYDPPRESMRQVISSLYAAGIRVKILTGDHPATTLHIAQQVGLRENTSFLTGEEVMKMDNAQLIASLGNCDIFARMFPEAKLKVINAFKLRGNVVAMTGDGVNDGPALKASDIGIAMGEKGSSIAREAADLVLTKDDPSVIIEAISNGRKIFTNLRKALRYIISIHIPIILIAAVPVMLRWKFPNIFTPIHIIFLELIMGPTCSVFFERETAEGDHLVRGPRRVSAPLFSRQEITLSIIQGLVIALVILSAYYYFMTAGASLLRVRSIVLITIILSNLFLTFINRSFTQTLWHTLRYKNPLTPVVLALSSIFLCLLLFSAAVKNIFGSETLSLVQFLLCFSAAAVATGWIEIYKMITARKTGR